MYIPSLWLYIATDALPSFAFLLPENFARFLTLVCMVLSIFALVQLSHRNERFGLALKYTFIMYGLLALTFLAPFIFVYWLGGLVRMVGLLAISVFGLMVRYNTLNGFADMAEDAQDFNHVSRLRRFFSIFIVTTVIEVILSYIPSPNFPLTSISTGIKVLMTIYKLVLCYKSIKLERTLKNT